MNLSIQSILLSSPWPNTVSLSFQHSGTSTQESIHMYRVDNGETERPIGDMDVLTVEDKKIILTLHELLQGLKVADVDAG